MTIKWGNHAYKGNPQFSQEGSTLVIVNDDDGDKGSWIGWYKDAFQSGDEFKVVGEWKVGTVNVVWQFDDGSYGGQPISAPDEVVKIPSKVKRLRLDGRLWGKAGRATFDIDLIPSDGSQPPPPPETEFELVQFPETAEAGAFTLFWTEREKDDIYEVYRSVDGGEAVMLGVTTALYFDTELLLEHIGSELCFHVAVGDATTPSGCLEVAPRQYEKPFVPERGAGTPVSGYLFKTDLYASLPENAPILSIFNGAEAGNAAGAPVTGYLDGRWLKLWVGSPEYVVREPIPCEELPGGCDEDEAEAFVTMQEEARVDSN
jgi:hypothetical protein